MNIYKIRKTSEFGSFQVYNTVTKQVQSNWIHFLDAHKTASDLNKRVNGRIGRAKFTRHKII